MTTTAQPLDSGNAAIVQIATERIITDLLDADTIAPMGSNHDDVRMAFPILAQASVSWHRYQLYGGDIRGQWFICLDRLRPYAGTPAGAAVEAVIRSAMQVLNSSGLFVAGR